MSSICTASNLLLVARVHLKMDKKLKKKISNKEKNYLSCINYAMFLFQIGLLQPVDHFDTIKTTSRWFILEKSWQFCYQLRIFTPFCFFFAAANFSFFFYKWRKIVFSDSFMNSKSQFKGTNHIKNQ